MTIEFEKEVPNRFAEEKMRSMFNQLEDMKAELRLYGQADLDEIKEAARPYMNASNRTMAMFASYMVDQCNYEKTLQRAAEKSAEKSKTHGEVIDWLARPEPKEYR